MLFKDLKKDYLIYILDKDQKEVYEGKIVEDPTGPHFDQNIRNNYQVVDINIAFNGKNGIYTFRNDTEVGYLGNLIFTSNLDVILREVNMIKSSAEKAIDPELIKGYQLSIQKCSKILETYDPSIRQNQENDRRLTSLEDSVNKLSSMFKEFMDEFKK